MNTQAPVRTLYCGRCEQHKPESEFTPARRKALAQANCRSCDNEWHRQNYHGTTLKAAKESKRQRRLNVVNAIKSERGCMECGESHPAALDFHHRDPMQKVKGIGTMVCQTTDIQQILDEIEKCDVLCSNCHRKAHWGKPRPRRNAVPRVEAAPLRLAV